MRIWDLPVEILCDKHLLGEHRELHAIWTILTEGKKGYSNHPETKRWVNYQDELKLRHNKQVEEMKKRGFKHNSYIEYVTWLQSAFTCFRPSRPYVNTIEEQKEILRRKGCKCKV